MINFITGFIFAVPIIALIVLISTYPNRYINGAYTHNDKLTPPKFKVVKVEEHMSTNRPGYRWIAKYTIEVFYVSKKDKVENTTLYFYDEIGKYNIGDELTLTNFVIAE